MSWPRATPARTAAQVIAVPTPRPRASSRVSTLTTPAARAYRETFLKELEEDKRRGLPTPVLAPDDHIQALKHSPEFQRCLALWLSIHHKEQAGIPLTADEAAMKAEPRSLPPN